MMAMTTNNSTKVKPNLRLILAPQKTKDKKRKL